MNQWLERMDQWKRSNQLLYVQYTLIKKGPQKFFGRLIQINDDQLLFYIDDTKSVMNLNINQIDQIEPHE